MSFLFVELGGALGAVARYAISLIPVKTGFPVLTLITNIIGAVLIGFIVGVTSNKEGISDNTVKSAFFRLSVLTSDNKKIKEKLNAKHIDSKSDVQVEIEAIMLREIQKELRDDTIVKPDSLPLDTDGTVYICPDFYSEENKTIGEIHAHIGRLKGSQPDKIASDVLKMLLFEKEQGIKYKKYITGLA